VRQHDILRFRDEQATQPPRAGDEIGRPLPPRCPERRQAGLASTVERGAQGHDAVPVPQPVKLVRQFQRNQLRPSPLTP
jgi:hypothetical protein